MSHKVKYIGFESRDFYFSIERRRGKKRKKQKYLAVKNSDWWSNENKSFLFNLKSEGRRFFPEENLWFSFEVLRRRRRLIMVTITMNSSCMTPFPGVELWVKKSLEISENDSQTPKISWHHVLVRFCFSFFFLKKNHDVKIPSNILSLFIWKIVKLIESWWRGCNRGRNYFNFIENFKSSSSLVAFLFEIYSWRIWFSRISTQITFTGRSLTTNPLFPPKLRCWYQEWRGK